MRIVIDFQDSQPDVEPAALALARTLVETAGGHQVWLAAATAAPQALETLRLAFADALPRERVRAFDAPARGGVGELVRRHALASLAPDVVLLPCAPAPGGPAAAPGLAPFAVVRADPRRVDAAGLWTELRAAAAEPLAAAPQDGTRPKLAYVSPLLPARSGIADYSAELLPELARYYDVELIVAQERVEGVDCFVQRPLDWFRVHGHGYERVLYHFGNSQAHQHMFGLIREIPGIVVLHDFFFSGILDNLERDGSWPQAFLHALYESHGFSGLLDHRRNGRVASIWKYPLNRGVLDHAAGVIVHSEFSQGLARGWYGEATTDGWRTIPLLKGLPPPTASDLRRQARALFRLAPDDYLVCSFGMLGRTKCNEELLDAFLASPLAGDPRCRLVFVGENEPGPYGAGLARKIAASRAKGRIRIAGYADAAAFANYLAAADCAVQLRASSRGESSGAALDCLLYGVPTIVNAHGSAAALPDELVLKLPDAFTGAELTAALVRLRTDAALRAQLSRRAREWIQAEHAPARAGRLYMEAIEHFTRHGRRAHYQALVNAVAPLCPPHELPALAAAIAFNHAALPPRQLLVDVSALVQSDIKTGIQRVVRSVLLALIAAPPPGFRVEPVFTQGGNRSYHYARTYGLAMVGENALALEDAPVELRPGDVFLGLDLFTNGTAQNRELLLSMRARGVEITFVVFDLLPVLRPEVFPFGAEQYFREFLHTVHAVADGVLCISRSVADELAAWVGAQGLRRRAPLKLGYFHLGADIHASLPSFGLPPDAAVVLAALAARPSFLMVGTLEPRKGHAQALAAFELLWERGVDVNLVIVGREGWMVEKLAERLASHPELGRRVHWLAGISDEMLLKLYAGTAALLQPSEGEGFGLPLIEAAQHDVPLIARDLPVFREVAGEHAYYFTGLGAEDLARSVLDWLALRREHKAPRPGGIRWLTWERSAQQVLDAIVRQHWYRVLPGTDSVVNGCDRL